MRSLVCYRSSQEHHDQYNIFVVATVNNASKSIIPSNIQSQLVIISKLCSFVVNRYILLFSTISKNVINFSPQGSFLCIWGFEPSTRWSKAPSPGPCSVAHVWLEEVVHISKLFQCVLPVPLYYPRQQEEHREVRRGVLESGSVAGGNTICLVACQGVSGLQPSHTCHESKIPPQHKTAAPQYIRSLLSRAVRPNESHKATSQASAESRMVAGSFTGLQHSERIHSTQIPGWPCLTPATALAARKGEQTFWNALQLWGDEADFKSVGTGGGH